MAVIASDAVASDALKSNAVTDDVQAPRKIATDIQNAPISPAPDIKALTIERAAATGNLQDRQLSEVSGLSASAKQPGLLFAINDSGNQPALYAINQTGQLLEQWRINSVNRDWEDMTRLTLAGKDYLVIGDTGDNLLVHKVYSLLFFAEPAIPARTQSLDPAFVLQFRYEDGPRNVEAFAAFGNAIYLLSKEPVSLASQSPNGVYRLELPANLEQLTHDSPLTATRIGSMPVRIGGLESRLAAALAGVDLSHPTALAFDANGNTAYVLTYREVLRIRRNTEQNWAEAFSQPAERVLSHKLPQAEALTVSSESVIWFTSENAGAPLWAVPINPPL